MSETYFSFIAWYNVLATFVVACTLLLYLTYTFYSTDVVRMYLLEIESNQTNNYFIGIRQIVRETPFAVLFERSDSNQDEFLSRGEFHAFFNSFDTNGITELIDWLIDWLIVFYACFYLFICVFDYNYCSYCYCYYY